MKPETTATSPMVRGLNAMREEFVRHRGPVTGVAMIPGTSWVATSGYDGAVARFNLETEDVELLGYHEHLVNHVSTNAEGSLIATCSSDYTVRLWCAATGNALRRLMGHDDDVEAFVFIGDDIGASASRDRKIIVWNLHDGSVLRALDGHDDAVLSLTYFNGCLFSSGDDMTLRVWDLDSGYMKQCWGPFENETDTCAIDAIHARAVLGCDDGYLRCFDLETGLLTDEISAHASGIKKVAVSSITGDVLSAAYDQRIIIWDGAEFTKKVEVERFLSTWERSLTWSPRGDLLLGGTFDGTVLSWDAQTGKLSAEVGDRDELGNACLNDVAASAGGQIVAVGDDGRVRLARASSTSIELLQIVEPPEGRVLMNAVALDDDLRLVVAGTHNHTLHLFETGEQQLRAHRDLKLGEGPINAIRIAKHKSYLSQIFAGCYSGRIMRVTRDASVIGIIDVHEGAVKSIRLHPKRPMGVSCGADGLLLGWSFDGKLIRRYVGHSAIINDVDLSPDGTRVCSVSRDFTAKVYDLESGLVEASFELGNRSLKSTCFFDDSQILVGDYWGHIIRIDLNTGEKSSRRIARNGISALSRTTNHVIASSYDGSIHAVRPNDLKIAATLVFMQQRLDEVG